MEAEQVPESPGGVANQTAVISPLIDAPPTLEQRLSRFDPANHGGEAMVSGRTCNGHRDSELMGDGTEPGLLSPRKSQKQKGNVTMALTRDFKKTVVARVQAGPAFAQVLLNEAVTLFVSGEADTAKLILRDLVNATVGFESLGEEIHKPAKSLHRMLSSSGNPTMSNISAIFAAITRALKVEIHTSVVTV